MLGDVDNVDRPVGAGNREFAIPEFDVVRPGFHHMRRDLAPLVDQPIGGDDDRRAGELRRARPESPDPHRHEVAVAVTVADQLGVDAELFRQHLLEGRAMALPMIHAAGHQHDAARRVEADLGMLVITAAGGGDRRRYADTEQLATLLRGFAAFGDTAVIGQHRGNHPNS